MQVYINNIISFGYLDRKYPHLKSAFIMLDSFLFDNSGTKVIYTKDLVKYILDYRISYQDLAETLEVLVKHGVLEERVDKVSKICFYIKSKYPTRS